MDIQQTAEQIQSFADANGIQIDADVVVNNMDSGDFIELNQAMDNSDNRAIAHILQKYKARLSENYKYFKVNAKYTQRESVQKINSLTFDALVESVKSGSGIDVSKLSIAEMKTLAHDKMEEAVNNPQAQLTANIIANANNQEQQQKVNPQTQAKMKQAELQRNSNNNAMQVTVPGNQSGTNDVEKVMGVDPGPTPQQTLVVTKSNQKPNEVNVFGLDDVNPVNQNGQINMSEEYSPQQINQDVMAPNGAHPESGGPSPLTHTAPGMGEMIHAIADIEAEDNVHGDESPLGNESMNDEVDIINQIIQNCDKMRGR